MTKSMEINGRQEKVFILQTWHLIFLLVIIVFQAGGAFLVAQYRLNEMDARANRVETWISGHEKYTIELKEDRDKQYYEIQLNLRKLMEKEGLVYESLRE